MEPELQSLRDKFGDTLCNYSYERCTNHEHIHFKKGEQDNIRKFQALRDCKLYNTKANLIGEYMELVKQYGLIVLFGEVFPPAALMSCICNFIQMKSQINNFQYSRRFRAEVGSGIGSFMDCFDIITKFSVFSNVGILFWTSKYI